MPRDKFNFDKVVKSLEHKKRDVPLLLGNLTKNHFLQENFDRQQFNGEKWVEPQRKKKKGGSSRNRSATLVQSSRLRRALINSLKAATWEKILIQINDVKYAGIHNYGGMIEKRERSAVVHFSKSGRFSKKKKANYAQKVSIGEHSIKMPKRQYIGNDPKLKKKQLDLILRETRGIWQV